MLQNTISEIKRDVNTLMDIINGSSLYSYGEEIYRYIADELIKALYADDIMKPAIANGIVLQVSAEDLAERLRDHQDKEAAIPMLMSILSFIDALGNIVDRNSLYEMLVGGEYYYFKGMLVTDMEGGSNMVEMIMVSDFSRIRLQALLANMQKGLAATVDYVTYKFDKDSYVMNVMPDASGEGYHAIIYRNPNIDGESPAVFIFDETSKEDMLISVLESNYRVGLMREWATYLWRELETNGNIKEFQKVGEDIGIRGFRLVDVTDELLRDIKRQGLANGSIRIPGVSEVVSLSDDMTLSGFLSDNTAALVEKVQNSYRPYFLPDVDEINPSFNIEGRQLYPEQLIASQAIVNALSDKRRIFLIGGMGVGKTCMAVKTVHVHAAKNKANKKRKGYRCIVFCPSHLVKKWQREILDSVPQATVTVIHGMNDVLNLDLKKDTDACEYYVVSKDTGKRSFIWKFAGRRDKRGLYHCPKCGQVLYPRKKFFNEDAEPILEKDLRNRSSYNSVCHCYVLANGKPVTDYIRMKVMTKDWFYRETSEEMADPFIYDSNGDIIGVNVRICGEPLWAADGSRTEYRTYAPVMMLKRLYRKGYFDYLIADEAHNYKAESSQGTMFGILTEMCEYTLALTGTLTGGKASDLFYLLFRMCPDEMLGDGYEWGSVQRFVERYGRIETTEYRSMDEKELFNESGRGKKTVVRSKEIPGISPVIFSRFLMGRAIFMTLDDMNVSLPSYKEIVKIVNMSDMDDELASAYKELQSKMQVFMRQHRQLGRSILGSYLNVLLAYPDKPFDNKPVVCPITGEVVAVPEQLDKDKIYPKEKALVTTLKKELSEGRNVFVYAVFSDTKDVTGRLVEIISKAGMKVCELKSSVNAEKREQWLAEQVKRGYKVIVGNPKLVETGLDLLDFPTLYFYETGYNLYTLRQASRRAWRIGQKKECRVYFSCYKDTLQEMALSLMGAKLEASLALEGKFFDDGLAAMSNGTDLSMEMAHMLINGIEAESASSVFKRMGSDVLSRVEAVEEEKASSVLLKFSEITKDDIKTLLSKASSKKEKRQIRETVIEGQLSLFGF